MAKPDFPALLAPGLHNLTSQGIYDLAVAPFPLDHRRQVLHSNLLAWAGELREVGVSAILWLDGSFMTEKPSPSDIDCVLWNPRWSQPGFVPSDETREKVGHLLDRSAARTIYGLDLYVECPSHEQLFDREAYWRGVLGFSHDRITAKGFAELSI